MVLIRYTTNAIPLLSVLLIGVLSLCSCENDMRDVDDIENIQKEEAVDISKDVRIIFSDSAMVKAELTGPELRIYHDSTGNYEFQKGLQIIFFDKEGKETQRIKSDYGVQRSIEGITEFRKNVVINMADGSIITTEELFYDENKKEYYNSVPIFMQFTDSRGNIQATSFRSDVDFENIRGESMTGFVIPSSGQVPSFGR